MSPLSASLLAVGLVSLVALVILVVRRKERERTDAMERAALAAGFTFERRGDLDLLKSLGDLPLYSQGRSRRANNVMTGRAGDQAVTVMEYRSTTGGGQQQHTSVQTVAVFPQADHALPDLQLAPENVLHKIGQVFGYQDIDFESNPEFSRRYLVRGPDESAIRARLYSDTLAFFAEHRGWTVEVRSGTVGVYRAGRRSTPDDLRTFLEDAREVLRNLRRA